MRRSIEIDAHGGRVEVAFDRGEVHAATALAPVCEVEYELKGGDASALVAFGKDGVREHGAVAQHARRRRPAATAWRAAKPRARR